MLRCWQGFLVSEAATSLPKLGMTEAWHPSGLASGSVRCAGTHVPQADAAKGAATEPKPEDFNIEEATTGQKPTSRSLSRYAGFRKQSQVVSFLV